MKYFIQASEETTVQGVPVHLSASFTETTLPKTIVVSANGNSIETPANGELAPQEPDPDKYISFNGEFSVESLSFNSINASGASAAFIQLLENQAIAAFEAIEAKYSSTPAA